MRDDGTGLLSLEVTQSFWPQRTGDGHVLSLDRTGLIHHNGGPSVSKAEIWFSIMSVRLVSVYNCSWCADNRVVDPILARLLLGAQISRSAWWYRPLVTAIMLLTDQSYARIRSDARSDWLIFNLGEH